MTAKSDQRITIVFGDGLLEAGYTSVPNLLLNHYAKLGITSDELVFLLHLLQYKWSSRDPYPRLQTIAEKMGKSWRQAHRYAHSLKAKGFLQITSRVLKGRGRTTSEYNLSALFLSVTEVHKQAGSGDSQTDLSKMSDGPSVKTVRWPLSGMSDLEENPREEDEVLKKSNNRNMTPNRKLDVEAFQPHQAPSDRGNVRSLENRTEGESRKPTGIAEIVFQRMDRVQPVPEDDSRRVIETYVADFASLLGDRATLKASVSRAYNLYQQSGVNIGSFLNVLFEAKSRCQENSATTKNRMAYFFAVVESLLGSRDHPPGQNQEAPGQAA